MSKILIIEDNIDVVEALKGKFEDEGYTVEYHLQKEGVLQKIEKFAPNLITLDISFSDENDTVGIDILKELRDNYPNTSELPVFVISGTMDAPRLEKLTALGITGYFLKDDCGYERVLEKIKDCLLASKNIVSGIQDTESEMIGKAPAFLEAMWHISNAAKAESNLLIQGKTGTGKEVAAQYYRRNSPRKDRPFVTILCSAFPGDLFETEVFGTVPGAFPQAKNKKGMVEEAQGGIVFFDEIAELTEAHQAKLLRLTQHKTFNRIGSSEPRHVDAVFIFATNRDLITEVQKNKFREDLYYRLETSKVELPALRERLNDIPILVEHFLRKCNIEKKKNILKVDDEIIGRFKKMSWKGNIRRLESYIENAVDNCQGDTIKLKDLEKKFADELKIENEQEVVQGSEFNKEIKYSDFKQLLDKTREGMEREYYTYHLEQNKGNVLKTSQALGMANAYLRQTMKRLGIEKK
ncbi:sigma-54-dependent Fis family transcriptional regulator [bacterium]|nr:sigma-54-dependent Fis family transcriptional regulator [bacterium]